MTTIMRRGAPAGMTALLAAAVLALAFGGASAGHSTPARGPLVPTPGDQTSPAVASNGSGFLVTWEDRASGVHSESDIYASRVDADGTTRDPDGIPIQTASGLQWTPDVASDGTNYLVVWTDSQSGTRNDVRAARVTPDGEVLDPGGFVLTAQEQYGGHGPHVDFDGENYLVVYGNYDRIRGVRVSTNGQILDPGGFAISDPAQPALRSGVSYGAGDYLVTWTSISQVLGARVTPEGVVLDPNGVPISPSVPERYSYPVSTFDGTNFVVAWEDSRLGDNVLRIYGARVSPGGTVLDPQNIPITPPPQPQSRDPGIASSGESSLIMFGLQDVRGARLAPGGVVLDPNGLVISSELNAQMEPEIAFGAGKYLAAWQDGRAAGHYDIIGSRIAADGTVLDPVGLLISGSGPPPDPVPAPPPPAPPPPPPPPVIEPPPPRPAPRCLVPRVVGLRLSLAQRKIRRAHCTVGGVRRKRSARAGIVLSQKPRARAIRRRGFPVSLVVGRRPVG